VRNKLVVFLIKLFILFAIWFILDELLRETRFWHALNSVVLREVLFFSKHLLILAGKIFDFTVQTAASNGISWAPHDKLIFYPAHYSSQNYPDLFISNRCLALNLMWTYSVFIIAFFGPWKKKLWFIPLGIFIINLLNILRVFGLGITVIYFPKYMEINHHLLFTYIVYFFTFILWVIWIRKYAKNDIIKIVEELKEKDKNKK
jgi:exosortase/archaeosortase family protein